MNDSEPDIRYTRLTDVSYLKEWIKDPRVLCHFPMEDDKEIEDALACWMSLVKYSCSLTATIDHVPCGIATLFLMPYKKVSHHCSFKICVNPRMHRRGIGTLLVRNLKHLARDYFKIESIHIEVFSGNPLLLLLEKQGFKKFAEQEDFVKLGSSYRARVCMEADWGADGS